jgi:antitoxin component HigA of HigAB toxin-antitoxin module
MSEEQEINLRLEAMRIIVDFYKRSNADLQDLIGASNVVYKFLKGGLPNE